MTAPSMPEVYAQEGWGAHEVATAVSGWGDAIPVDGVRPSWLPDEVVWQWTIGDGEWENGISVSGYVDCGSFALITAIRLPVPRYDFVYLALERGMVPNMRGVRPDDWDGGEVLMRGDVMFDMECFAENDFMWRHDTGSDDIIGYHATSTALPLAHPAASTPVTLYREIDALGGVSQGPWDDGYSAALTDVLLILMKRGFSEEQDISAALPAHNINSYVDGYEDALEVAAHPAAPQGEGIELCVMVCPQCEGEGFYADGVDEAACSTECTRCRSNGWIVDTVALAALAHPAMPQGEAFERIVAAAKRVVSDYPAAAGAYSDIEGGDGNPGWGSIRSLAEALAALAPAAIAAVSADEKRDDHRGWQIDHSPPPIPCRDFDFVATHPDFDGAPDANDNRQVFSRTINGVVAEIDGWYEEQVA